jgi:hypothetical protein
MSFRNRKISNTSADNIADAIVRSRYGDDYQEAHDAVHVAGSVLEEKIEVLAGETPARHAWDALTKEQQEGAALHGHRLHWYQYTRVTVEHLTVNFSHSFDTEGFQVLSRHLAENTVSVFTEDWRKWDFHGQLEQAVLAAPEHAAYLAAYEAFDKARRDYEQVQRELRKEMRGRNTKTVLEAWPEAAPFVHEHYGHVTADVSATITQPMDTVIANALTPAITLVAE